MKFLAEGELYRDTAACLRFLRDLGEPRDGAPPTARERVHLYWRGPVGAKQAFAIKSFLATQDLERAELWLWLDGESGYEGHAENPFLRPLLSLIQVRRFDPEAEARGTPLEGRPDLYGYPDPTARSNPMRLLVLHNYGGTYVDMDTMFLRDLRALRDDPYFTQEFCYRWSAHLDCGSNAVLRLGARGRIVSELLLRCVAMGSCRPRSVLRFDVNRGLDLLVLPCVFFDPLWPTFDGQDRYPVPFRRFEDFFRGFTWRFRRDPAIVSYRDFFAGAFAYQWHNAWDAAEVPGSYFGLFDREFDRILRERLEIEIP